MEVVREICNPQSEDLIIKLPREFIKKKIEVIILPFRREEKKKTGKKERLLKIYNESKGTLPKGYKFNRDEAYIKPGVDIIKETRGILKGSRFNSKIYFDQKRKEKELES